MNNTRIAILGTNADLSKQLIRYDLAELKRIVSEARPDGLGVEIERDECECGDLSRAPVGVREALVPLAQQRVAVVVAIGAGSNQELRASNEWIPAALIRGLDHMLTGVQKTAKNAGRGNSALLSHVCGRNCHLEESSRGGRGRRACETTNEKMLANIVKMAERAPQTCILIAVQCRRKHWFEPKLWRLPGRRLVNYREL